MGGAFFNPLSRVGNQPKFLSAGKYKPRFQKTFDTYIFQDAHMQVVKFLIPQPFVFVIFSYVTIK